MVTKDISEAAKEINEILKYIPEEEVNKIPVKLREFFKEIESKDYVVNINPNILLENQDLKEETKDIIALIYRNYWCSEEEKKELDQKLIENDKRFEEKLREKYNPDNIFKNNVSSEKEEIKDQSLVVTNTEKWYKKFLNFIKSIFIKR